MLKSDEEKGIRPMKILYVTTVGSTMGFFRSFVQQLLEQGHRVDIATNENHSKVPGCYREWGCAVYSIDTSRSPFNKGNLRAIKQLKRLVETEKYDIVHCHTPVAAMCTRIACRKARKQHTKVFYTAHGFHFYKGAPLKNWLIYYPVEKVCSYFTDVLITINQEDYALAQKKMRAKRITYVPGVGIDLAKFGQVRVDKAEKRRELGIPEKAPLLLSVGELNENKNHETVIRAIKDMDVYYIIAGKGGLQEHLQHVIDALGITDKVKLLGLREDVDELCETADIYVMPSYREGLSVALMEAMASGLPCAVSRIRGNVDLVEDKKGGALFDPHSVAECKKAIEYTLQADHARMVAYNLEKISGFCMESVNKRMQEILSATG